MEKEIIKHANKLEQALLAGLEEQTNRLDPYYAFKNYCYRNFGWFKKWGQEVKRYYNEKYPLLK